MNFFYFFVARKESRIALTDLDLFPRIGNPHDSSARQRVRWINGEMFPGRLGFF